MLFFAKVFLLKFLHFYKMTHLQHFFITDCGSNPVDIVVLLDSSVYVGSSNFQKLKVFTAHFAQSFEIGPNKVQIGVETFSTIAHHEFNMNSYNDTSSLVDAVHLIDYHPGYIRTDLALKYVESHSFKAAAGDRTDVSNILIVMTDRQSINPVLTSLETLKLHQMNLTVFAIGIGTLTSSTELGYIASDPHHVFSVDNFNALSTIQAELRNAVCKGIMGLDARKPVFRVLRTSKAQTSLRIRAVWPAPLLFA